MVLAVSTTRSARSRAVPAQPPHAATTNRATCTASTRLARDLHAGLRPVQPSPAIRHDRDGGLTNGGVRLRRRIHPTKTAAGRSGNERQSSGKLRHPLRQCGENLSLTVSARAAPFGDLGERSTTAGAMACARIERADINTGRYRRFDHAFPLSAKRLPRYPSRDLRPDGRTGICPSSRDGPREPLFR